MGCLDPIRSWTAPTTAGVPADHLLRSFPPWVLDDGTRVVVLELAHLGSGKSKWFRLSRVRRLTAVAVDAALNEAQQVERTRAAEEQQRLAAAARLEKEASALRKGATP